MHVVENPELITHSTMYMSEELGPIRRAVDFLGRHVSEKFNIDARTNRRPTRVARHVVEGDKPAPLAATMTDSHDMECVISTVR